MKKTDDTNAPRFAQPLNRQPQTRPGITRPFFDTLFRPAGHDMLLLSAHLEFLPEPAPPRPGDLTFFNLDHP